jgi:VCBS repeat-containing protein
MSSQELMDARGIKGNSAPVVSGPVVLNDLEEDGTCIISVDDLLTNANDGDGDTLSVTDLTVNAGTLEALGENNWRYTPSADFHGLVAFDYRVSDGTESVVASASLNVVSVNDVPVVEESESHDLFGALIAEGTLNASDVDGDILTFSVTGHPQHGTCTVNADGNWIYTAEDGYCGSDQVVITIEDGQGGSVQTSLDFTVNVYRGGDLIIDGNAPSTIRLDGIGRERLNFSCEENDLKVSISDAGSILLKGYLSDPQNSIACLETIDGSLNLAMENFVDAEQSGFSFIGYRWSKGSDNFSDFMRGGDDADCLFGLDRDDVLWGHDGNDVLWGDAGNDTLVGGLGDDVLTGGSGGDALWGDHDDDLLYGGTGDDFLAGGADNDELYGGSGKDRLYGGSAQDHLYGGEGADILNGGKGDDMLRGGTGDDLYVFQQGDGWDTVRDAEQGVRGWLQHGFGGNDTVRFGESVDGDQVSFFMHHGTLQIQYGDGDLVEILKQKQAKNTIERFELADGRYLSDSDIHQLIQSMSAFAVNEGIGMKSMEDVRCNEELMTMVAASWHQ